MLRRFLLTLLSSWIVNPLGILVAQGFGIANSPVVILVLLATGACVPFQLLINECVAAAESRGRLHAKKAQLALLLFVQFGVCTLSVTWFATQNFPLPLTVLVAIQLAVSNGLSYQTSLRYYRLIMTNHVRLRTSVIVGAMPGTATLLLYFAYCTASSWLAGFPSEFFIVASTVIPAVIQWWYVRRIPINIDTAINYSNTKDFPVPLNRWLLAAALALAALSLGSSRLRETIALSRIDYVALLLVALNSILSLINTLTRAAFLSQQGAVYRTRLARGVISLSVACALSLVLNPSMFLLLALLCTQLAIAWVIESGRNIPVEKRW